jgi:predicted nucleic acid-binding protein
MSVTVDTNLLIHSSDSASPRHQRANDLVSGLVTGAEILYVFWPVLMAYVRISTHPSIFTHPLAPDAARANVSALLEQPLVRAPGEAAGFQNS